MPIYLGGFSASGQQDPARYLSWNYWVLLGQEYFGIFLGGGGCVGSSYLWSLTVHIQVLRSETRLSCND